jgi:hypothetical protein
MDYEFHSIVEKLAILEGRIAPTDKHLSETTTKQKKPALFSNLKKDEVAEEKSDDVLSQVKASLVDYLKSAEENLKQDKDLVAKKKQDLDLKKKELKSLELQTKKKKADTSADTLAEAPGQLQPGDRVAVIGQNEHQGEFAEVVELSPSGKFVVVSLERTGDDVSMHLSDVELTADDSQLDDEDADNDTDDSEFIEEEPNQTPAGGEASAGESNSTYATGSNNTYAESAPVKTIDFPIVEMGGSVLVEIHGNERDGFNIRRAGRDLPTKFASLADAELALDMFKAHRAKQQADNESADYIEEK